MNDPWTFGWGQLLTIVGFVITITIAAIGFRSFERWRREKLEERKIETAIEALSLAYEAKYVFEAIRSPASFPYETRDMPRWEYESDQQFRAREPYYAILKRIEGNRDFFDRLFRLQPRFMALFGADAERIFVKCHQARRYIEVSAGMLMKTVTNEPKWDEANERRRNQWEADIWEGMDDALKNERLPQACRVSNALAEFQSEIVAICGPVAEQKKLKGGNRLFSWKGSKRSTDGAK